MYPVITVFGRDIGVYGLCAVAGLLLCAFVATKLSKPLGLNVYSIAIVMLVIGGGLVVGGHILYGITNIGRMYNAFAENAAHLEFLKVVATVAYGFGGMVFYGGFLGSCVALLIYNKVTHFEQKERLFDVLAVCTPLFHTFGRIGCFFGGCCYGIESKFGFIVYNNEYSPGINGVTRFPVQLVEAACNLLIFIALFTMYKKNVQNGKLIYMYMLIYPVVRFSLEFLRGDEIRGRWLFDLSTSQWVSIILFVFASVKLMLRRRKIPGCCDAA